jgi:excisionase family DNA binding protein
MYASEKHKNEVPTMADVVYTIEEAAKILKVSSATIRRMIDDGDIKVIRVRGQIRIPKDEIDRILRGQ